MIVEDWKPFLHELSAELLRDPDVHFVLKDQEHYAQAIETSWLGYWAASKTVVQKLERRLGIDLPLSYRKFLLTTNGWGPLDRFVNSLLTANEVDWFGKTDPDIVSAWNTHYDPAYSIPDERYLVYGETQDVCDIRNEYLNDCLKISDQGDSCWILLNPLIRDENGEWEAWWLASWLAGAVRYRSFYDLMQAQLEKARDYQPDPAG